MSNRWVLGARPKTLPAAIVPVVVGTAAASNTVAINWVYALGALVVALGMQVAVNYANDYSDGVRGTDDARVGPPRLVASKLAEPVQVKRAAFISFGVACVAGLALAVAVNPWLIVVGVASVAAGWFYTGGSKPYGYSGFGELAVFVFFGLIATCGSQYVQCQCITPVGLAAGTAVGLIAMALLVVNNLRDRENDERVGKRTLAVRLGDKGTRYLFVVCVGLPLVIASLMAFASPWTLLVWFSLPLAKKVTRPVDKGASGRELIAVLQGTARYQLVFGALLSIGLWA